MIEFCENQQLTRGGALDIGALGNEAHSVEVELYPAAGAEIVWLNEALARLDPKFDELKGSLPAYRQHLLESCAYRPRSHVNTTEVSSVHGVADRYGGRGLAGNGGSGRAAFLNGYYVKGIGRTSLLGSGEEISHASGDAYLEEAIREAIFGEIMSAELPFSAVRTLAIISLNERVHWKEVNKSENLVLSVRPAFLRLGHFARALCFRSIAERNGDLDERRVRNAFGSLVRAAGMDGVRDWLATAHTRIAHQLSYCFVHRITQGSPTLSNWAMDLRVLDFGASSTLPSYQSAILSPIGSGVRYVDSLRAVYEEVHHLAAYAQQHVPGLEDIENQIRIWQEEGVALYKRNVIVEFCRCVGLTKADIDSLTPGEINAITTGIERMLREERRSKVDLIKNPAATGKLRNYESELDGIFREAVPYFESRRLGKPLMQMPRPALFREDAKKRLYEEADPLANAETAPYHRPAEAQVTQTISRWVAANRRDSKVLLTGLVNVGFAVSSRHTLVLFSDGETIYGVDEKQPKIHLTTLDEWKSRDNDLVTSSVLALEGV